MELPVLAAAERALAEAGVDAWVVYDFRGSNPILTRLLPQRRTTRRVWLVIRRGEAPVLLVHFIDAFAFDGVPVAKEIYRTWPEMVAMLARHLGGASRVAMEYSPGGMLPAVSFADAGAVEMIRGLGKEVVSSANAIQIAIARWSAEAVAAHDRACREVEQVKDAAFDLIRRRVAARERVHEVEVQAFIIERFVALSLEYDHAPNVSVNEHAGDPHYDPTPATSRDITPGDWVLIDLWGRRPGEQHIFCDITWVGVAAPEPTPRQREVFGIVKAARDASLAAVRDAWAAGRTIPGWQADDAAANVLRASPYGEFVRHRTGHSLSPGPFVHGLGANLDNMETHDTRPLAPGLGFTIEPGLYLPDFGVRLEINVYMDPEKGPRVTSCVQDEVVRLASE